MDTSITFTSEFNAKTIAYLLKFSLNYCNINNFLSDGFVHDRDNNKYDLNLKLSYGTHNIIYENNIIQLKYEKSPNLYSTADDIKHFETLILSSDTKHNLLQFIEAARLSNANPDKNDKLLCRILKQGGSWGILSKISKIRPLEESISTSGGLTFNNLDDSLMISSLPGFFAAGEMLDWEAPTGGYLLQGCFSTAYHVSDSIFSYFTS